MAKTADNYSTLAARFDKTLLARVNQGSGFQEIDIERLTPRSNQPRRYFGEGELAALTESVKTQGVRNPIHVRRAEGDLFEILAGERRYRAAQQVGLARVPVIVHELNDADANTLAVLDNLHRVDLNPIEETEAILILAQVALGVNRETAIAKIRTAANVSKGRAQDSIGESELQTLSDVFSRSVGRLTVLSFAQTRLPLLSLPETLYEAVLSGQLPYTVAIPLKSISDDVQRKALVERAINEKLTRAQVAKLIREANQPPLSLRKLESQVKSARGYLATEHLKRIPAAKRVEFTKLVETFIMQAQALLKEKGNA